NDLSLFREYWQSMPNQHHLDLNLIPLLMNTRTIYQSVHLTRRFGNHLVELQVIDDFRIPHRHPDIIPRNDDIFLGFLDFVLDQAIRIIITEAPTEEDHKKQRDQTKRKHADISLLSTFQV